MAQYPLYTTRGDWVGMLVDSNLYSTQGEWIGWVNPGGIVFSVVGEYIGWLSKDFRVLRKRDIVETIPRRAPPARPALKIRMPSSAPLAPLMPDLTYDTIDVFEEMPERLHTIDADPSAKDID
jgi:hypothetical protein